MRITGLSTGLDIDEIVKNSMKPYRVKIDIKGQEKEVLEIKQKLYREIIKDSREFYNKYFDITKSDSLLLSRNWATAKFTSSDENLVSVTGSGDAKVDKYTITGNVAKANQKVISTGINAGDKIIINGEEFELKGDTEKERANNLNDEIKAKGINVRVKYTEFAGTAGTDGTSGVNASGFVFESTILGKDNNFTISGTFADDIGSVVKGEDSTFTKNTIELNDIKGKKIVINGKFIDLTGKETEKEVSDYINEVLNDTGIGVESTFETGKITLTSNIAGASQEVNVKIATEGSGGEDALIRIKNSSGGVYTHTGISNMVTIDGIEFTFNNDINNEVIINGQQDITNLKDNLVKFFNDYNNLIEKFNKLISEKRDKSFMPLTEDQKKEMSEDEIKLWNEKVEKGLLSRDSDLSRINDSLKQAMRTLVDGTGGLNLEKIGICPVKDYSGSKNGTFTIDENKLAKALKENSEEIMNIFIKSVPDDKILTDGEKYSKTGILNRVKDILYNETFKSSSILLKKVGYEGTASAFNNEISLSIQRYEQKMKDMEKDFSIREQALYSKYATLETMMNKYNSQQSYLIQQLGLG